MHYGMKVLLCYRQYFIRVFLSSTSVSYAIQADRRSALSYLITIPAAFEFDANNFVGFGWVCLASCLREFGWGYRYERPLTKHSNRCSGIARKLRTGSALPCHQQVEDDAEDKSYWHHHSSCYTSCDSFEVVHARCEGRVLTEAAVR